MLDIINVEKTFNPGTINEKKALNGINLHLDEGDFVTVIGGNGAGKSTMLNMIAGVYSCDTGSIIFMFGLSCNSLIRFGDNICGIIFFVRG